MHAQRRRFRRDVAGIRDPVPSGSLHHPGQKESSSGTAGADYSPNQRAEPGSVQTGLEAGRLRGTDAKVRGAPEIKLSRI